MTRRSPIILVSLFLALAGCRARDASQVAGVVGKDDPRLEMYIEQDQWPGACQNSTNPATRESQRQSPIALHIEDFQQAPRSQMTFSYTDTTFQVIDNGHSIQANVKGDGGYLEFEGDRYPLIQFHFHERSEHVLFGNRYAGEVHFVHAGTNGIVALGVLLVEGDLTNSALEAFWQAVPPSKAKTKHQTTHNVRTLVSEVQFNPQTFLPKENYLVYNGFLTTPNCDETVIHAVSTETIGLSQDSLHKLQGYYQQTNRDLQPPGNPDVRDYRVATVAE